MAPTTVLTKDPCPLGLLEKRNIARSSIAGEPLLAAAVFDGHGGAKVVTAMGARG